MTINKEEDEKRYISGYDYRVGKSTATRKRGKINRTSDMFS